MKVKKIWKSIAIFLVIVIAAYVFLRKNSTLARPYYPAVSIATNPAGICALAEYNFKGGERWYWLDPYSWFVLAPGDAFYTITDLRTGKIIRDSTTQILFSITAHSQTSVKMGKDIFYWSKDGKKANFPGEAPDYFYEWTDIQECEGTKTQSEFSNLECNSDNPSNVCNNLRAKLQPWLG